jgi:hypothetical protein
MMVLRGWVDQQPITLSLKPGALTVAWAETTVVVVDRAGRLWSFYTHGHHFRRGLNGKILSKWSHTGSRQRRILQGSEANLVVQRAADIMQTLHQRLVITAPQLGAGSSPAGTEDTVREIVRCAAAFDAAAARADACRFHNVYKPIGILPPDQYMALVVQMTEGCSFNSCTFCSFYKGRPFHIKSPQELRSHVIAALAFLGDSIHMRRGVFLADANALVVPQPQLLELLDTLAETLGEKNALFAFVDGFSGQKKTAQDYAALSRRGLQRVYVGLESGHDPLLAAVKKPGQAADAVSAVRQMKSGGLNVGVIVMVGLGGEQYVKGHVHDTIHILNQMDLGRGDLLYFSEFITSGVPFRSPDIEESAPEPQVLSPAKLKAQREGIIAGLRFPGHGPKIATYDIREFLY